MNIVTQFNQIRSFLKPNLNWLNQEVLNSYPKSFEHYPQEWIDLLSQLDKEELWKIDCSKSATVTRVEAAA